MSDDPNPPINKRDPGNPSPNPAPPKVPAEQAPLDGPQDDDL